MSANDEEMVVAKKHFAEKNARATNAKVNEFAELKKSFTEAYAIKPSPISRKQKATLVDELVTKLAAAAEKYENGDDSGRTGARMALKAIRDFLLILSLEHQNRHFMTPISGLRRAFIDIDRGVKNPMFKRQKLGSHAIGHSWHLVQAEAAFASAALKHLGENATAADKQVAAILVGLGFQKKRYQAGDHVKKAGAHRPEITDRTVRYWRAEFHKTLKTKNLATRLYYELMDGLKSKPCPAAPDITPQKSRLLRELEQALRKLRPTA